MIIGIVGKPNCGKSTMFKALTQADVYIANYPFATIKPNIGMAYVRIDCVCKEFGKQCNPREGYCTQGQRFVGVKLIDVAGIVPGAHEGKGMGNQFLDDLRQADALIHVIDAAGATNAGGEPVQPLTNDPAEDIKFLEVELDMWYLGILVKGWEKLARQSQQEKKEPRKVISAQLSGLGVTEEIAEAALRKMQLQDLPPINWSQDHLMKLASELRQMTKKMVIACNKIDIPGAAENITRLKQQFPNHMLIPCSGDSELALKEANKHSLITYLPGDSTFTIKDPSKLTEKQSKALQYIKETILDKFGSTGVQKAINAAVFELLRYKAIFPGGINNLVDSKGNCLPDCYLMPPQATPLDFAFRIHSDIGQGYVKAMDVKTKRPIAKDHILEHRSVVEIMSSK